MPDILSINNLVVQYGTQKAVNDVSISVRQGDILGVLGPNGAGKSTMFRAILNLLPHRGQVSLFGADTRDRRHLLPFVGYVPQRMDFERLFPATVHDVIVMGVIPNGRRRRGLAILQQNGLANRYLNMPKSEEMVNMVLDEVGMSSLRDSRIGALSGGQMQRVFIAQSLVRNPLLIILDEPVGGMDVESQELFYSAMQRAARDMHITIILSLHDLEMLEAYTNRVLFLNNSVLYHGDTKKFFADKDQVRMYTEASVHAGGHTRGV